MVLPSVWQTRSKKTGESHRFWRFWYRDYLGHRRYGTGTRDRHETLKLATVLEDEHREIRLGLRAMPAENKLATPYPEVRDEYIEWGINCGGRKGRPWSATHLRNKKSRLAWWERRLRIRALGDFRGRLPEVEQALRGLKADGRSAKTVVEYADTLVSFCAWCVKREYLPENPFRHLQRIHVDPVEIRRALTLEEIQALLQVASPGRRLIYIVALVTGLRANELANLTPRHLDREERGLILEAKWTKNRKPGFTPLPEGVFSDLDRLASHVAPSMPLLAVPTHTARMLDEDLEAADITKRTDEGKVDFHALRTTFTTLIIEAGANPKEAQELARHSTAELTMNTYARARNIRLREITEAVSKTITEYSEKPVRRE